MSGQAAGGGEHVLDCYRHVSPSQGPGIQIINGITGIFGGIGSGIGNIGNVILGIPPAATSTPQPEEQKEEQEQEKEDMEVDGICSATCNNWPYSQCRVELRRRDGSWQSATCLNPYVARPGPFNPWPRKYTNYPE